MCDHRYVGTGKTLIVRTLAKELKRQFINISITEVIKGEIGTGEKRVVEIFRQAKTQAPTLVFIDEFQALFTARREGEGANPLSSTLSSCLDDVVRWNSAAGPRHLITVVAATNEPWSIDRGFLRPGRFDRHIFVGPVEAVARKQFITEQQWFPAPPLEMAEVPLTQAEVDELIARTDGCTGAELTHLLQRCKAHALREVMPSPSSPVPTTIQVCKRHWDLALRDCQLAKGNVEKYSSWKA